MKYNSPSYWKSLLLLDEFSWVSVQTARAYRQVKSLPIHLPYCLEKKRVRSNLYVLFRALYIDEVILKIQILNLNFSIRGHSLGDEYMAGQVSVLGVWWPQLECNSLSKCRKGWSLSWAGHLIYVESTPYGHHVAPWIGVAARVGLFFLRLFT